MTGDEPAPDELVDRGMQRLFDADRGFRQWLQERQGRLGVRTETVPGTMPGTDTGIVSVPLANAFAD